MVYMFDYHSSISESMRQANIDTRCNFYARINLNEQFIWTNISRPADFLC